MSMASISTGRPDAIAHHFTNGQIMIKRVILGCLSERLLNLGLAQPDRRHIFQCLIARKKGMEAAIRGTYIGVSKLTRVLMGFEVSGNIRCTV